MELKPRFTNRAIKRLFECHQIDVMNLDGETLNDIGKRLLITQAGHADTDAASVADACDELTPGEHLDILSSAIRRDLTPAYLREATAKAATADKSE